MPSLGEAARRLAGSAPSAIDPDVYSVLRAVWQTYPRAAAAWRAVIPAEHPTEERWTRLSEGTPLLDGTMVQWDASPLRQQYRRLVRIFRSPSFSHLDALGDLQRLVTQPTCEPNHWARLFFQAEVNEPGPELVLGGYIIQPFLYMFARRVAPRLKKEDWRRSRCPVCGGTPYHGYLSPPSRRKVLICGKCMCPWTIPRLQCPFCDNTAQESLGYFYLDQSDHQRIDYCTACRSILPITIHPESGRPFPLLDHLVSLPLQNAVERSR